MVKYIQERCVHVDVDLKVTDLIKVYDNFISLDQCDKMIDWFNSNQSLQEDGIPKDVPASDYKVCKETTVPKSNLADFLTEITIGAYNNAIKDGCPFPNPNIVKLSLNGYTIRRYKKNEGIFKPHIDQQSGDTVSRLFSILIYLNDVDEGGETEFPEWLSLIHI